MAAELKETPMIKQFMELKVVHQDLEVLLQ